MSMTTRLELVKANNAAIKAAVMRRKGLSVAVFGSVARGEDRQESDIDFLVTFAPEASLLDQAGLQTDLAELLDCPVDVISKGGLKPRDSHILREAVSL